MAKKEIPKPPGHLSTASKSFWARVVTDYALENHHLTILRLACETLDQIETARAIVSAAPMVRDRFDQLKENPMHRVELQGAIVFARLLRELNLDVEPPPDTSRPPPLYE